MSQRCWPETRYRRIETGTYPGCQCRGPVRSPACPEPDRRGHRWGRTRGKIGYQGAKVDIIRPRVRGADGEEMPLPSWAAATAEDWLDKTAMNLMLIGVATRKIGRAVRLPEGPLARVDGDGTSKSAASRRFLALSQQ